MSSKVFKLLVYAIVALLLLLVFYTYFAPLFFVSQDISKEIGKRLDAAEIEEGKLFDVGLAFNEGFSLSAGKFDKPNRGVLFKCVDPLFCCVSPVRGCKIVVGSRQIKVQESFSSKAYVRCAREEDLDVCDVYFGQLKPAELKIKKFEFPKEVREPLNGEEVVVEIGNSGSRKAENVKVLLKVEKTEMKGQDYIKLLKYEKTFDFGSVEKESSKEWKHSLKFFDNGDYLISVKVFADEAGFAFDEKPVKVFGLYVESACRTLDKEKPRIKNDKCIVRHNCRDCEAYECSLGWQKLGVEESAIVERFVDHVNVVVGMEECQ